MIADDAGWIWMEELIALVDKEPLGDNEKWKTVRMATTPAFRSLTPLQALVRSRPWGKVNQMTYLAVPYTDPDPAVREARFEAANAAAAALMAAGEIVFSPISHTHPMVKYGLPVEFEFYRLLDSFFVGIASTVIVLKMPGWEESVGVQTEIAIAKHLGKRIEYLKPIEPKEIV